MHLPCLSFVMIRDKSILLKLNSETSDETFLFHALKSFRPSRMRCPTCGALGGHRRRGSYKRWMISVVDGNRCERQIRIPLYQCPSCGHSHALIPDILIPFASYSLRFILIVLRSYLERSCTVRVLCARWQISASTLYNWIHLFSHHFSAWRGILYRIRRVELRALDDVENTTAFPSAFFQRFGFSFLQQSQTAHSVPVADSSGGT